jgi:uncharacterized protein YkwD
MESHHSHKSLLALLMLVVVFVVALYNFAPVIKEGIESIGDTAQEFKENSEDVIQSVQEEIFSSPLTNKGTTTRSTLTRSGVISNTNIERQKEGRGVLTENTQLNKAAEAKLKDMFAKQYFEHISPDGHGPGYVIQQAGYNYIVVGENLALGNFKNDAELVAAWMASPGHRANILNTRFTEIGVAVGQGMYNGSKTWIAVQEFGKPAAECPQIDAALKITIEREKAEVDALSADLNRRKSELSTMPKNTPEEQATYNKKVDEYNVLVKQYNDNLATLHAHIDTYNQQVRNFNACVRR